MAEQPPRTNGEATDQSSTESDPFYCSAHSEENKGEEEFVSSSEKYFDYKTITDVENIVNIDDSIPYNPATEVLKYDTLKRMLLSEHVPAVLCLVNTTGLPKSLKSVTVKTVIKNFAREEVDFKSKPKCLAVYDLTILSRHPDQPRGYTWKLSSKRCGVAYFILSYLVRRDALHEQRFCLEHIPDEHKKLFNSKILNRHFHWVYRDGLVNYSCLMSDSGKRQLYRSGVSLIRIWDADGANKAIHDFQHIVSRHFTRNLRLAFFRLDRDADKFNEPLDTTLVQHRPLCREQTCLQYLLNTVSPSGNESDEQAKGTTVMVATTHEDSIDMMKLEQAREAIMKAAREQHIDHVVYDEFLHGSVGIKPDTLKQQQAILEKAAYYNLKYTVNVPLKWIFLRSALAGEKKPKLFIEIPQLRGLSKELEFNDAEFENFLATFTSFGSILYCPEYPPLKTHILTDIPKFCELLDRLCYPKPEDSARYADISKYGIVSEKEAASILKSLSDHHLIDHFMKVLLSLGMAAEVPKNRLKGCSLSEESYFLPNARKSMEADTQFLQESVYIVVTSNHNPLDIQATLVRSILKEIKETSLEVSMRFNTSCFSLADSNTHLTLVFHHNSVEIRLKSAASIDELERLQSQLLLYCSHAMDQHSDHNKGLQWYIGLICTAGDKEELTFHSIEKEEACKDCMKILTPLQRSWITASQKHFIQHVHSCRSEPRLSELFKIAEDLSSQDVSSESLASCLGLTPKQLQMIADLTGCDKIMMILLVWKQTRQRPYQPLDQLLKKLLKPPVTN